MLSTESDAAEVQNAAEVQSAAADLQAQMPLQSPVVEVQQSSPADLQAQIPFPSPKRRSQRASTADVPPAIPNTRMQQMQTPQMQMPRRQMRAPSWGQAQLNPMNSRNFRDDDELPMAASPSPEPDPDISDSGPLSLSTRVEYKALPKGQSQAVFGLVTVQAEEVSEARPEQAERRPMDIVCVLDVSGSMGCNNKINDLKEAMRFIISESQPQDRLSIVAFQSFAERKIRLRRMDSQGKDEAMLETMRLNAGGGTSIAAGLDMGLAVLEGRRQRNSVSAILLLTDGQDHSTRHQLTALTQRAAKVCGLYAFGFGADHDADLLREISEQARTPYTFVENTSTVKDAFAGVVGGLSSIVAQKIELSLESKALLKEVNTPFEVQRDGDKKAKVIVPDIFAGERKDILVELSVPAGSDGSIELLTASARYLDLRGSRSVLVQIAPVSMSVELVEQQPEMEPDVEVADQRERVEVTRALEQAAQQSDEGHFREAQELLRQQRSKVSKRTNVSQALDLELQDAEARMNQSSWQLGSAEVKDAFQMHKMQRCTNMASSSSAQVAKKSKAMYFSQTQTAWTMRSAGPSSG